MAALAAVFGCQSQSPSSASPAATTAQVFAPPLQAASLPVARNAAELLELVRGLKLSGRVELAPVSELSVPAVASPVLAPRAGLALWNELVRARPPVQFQPIIVSRETWAQLLEQPPDERRAATTSDIDKARTLTAAAFFAEREATLEKEWQDMDENSRIRHEPVSNWLAQQRRSRDAMTEKDVTSAGTSRAPNEPPAFQFPVMREQIERALGTSRSGRQPLTPAYDDSVRVLVLSAPAASLPAHLRFGGFNDCPEPDAQVVALSHWQEQYGARLVYVGSDTLELLVERPPRDLEAAKKLAWEQYLFCADIVDQGTNSIAALGRELAGSPTWFFWWD